MRQACNILAVIALTVDAELLADLLPPENYVAMLPLFLGGVIFASARLYGFRHGVFALLLIVSFSALRQQEPFFERSHWRLIAVWRLAAFIGVAIIMAQFADQLRRARADATKKAEVVAALNEVMSSVDDGFSSIDRYHD